MLLLPALLILLDVAVLVTLAVYMGTKKMDVSFKEILHVAFALAELALTLAWCFLLWKRRWGTSRHILRKLKGSQFFDNIGYSGYMESQFIEDTLHILHFNVDFETY
jgi:hypothetical protein